ncbi:hypothetical protein [Streptomyces sp. NPDC020362]|uniref:hypothetical protein n=1 Tax=unclassified Streptomyces TaxID=2593676 RepID=UPI0033C1DCF6
MSAQTKTDTFAALIGCFTTDLAALTGDEPKRVTSPTAFIDLVERVRDVLDMTSVGTLQDASEELDSAVIYLTDALTSQASDQPSLLAWARTHLRDAIETASCTALSALCAAPTPHPARPGRSQWPLNHESERSRTS